MKKYFLLFIILCCLPLIGHSQTISSATSTDYVNIKNGTQTIIFKTQMDLINYVNQTEELKKKNELVINEMEGLVYAIKKKDVEIQYLYQFLSQVQQAGKGIMKLENEDDKKIASNKFVESINNQIMVILLNSVKGK